MALFIDNINEVINRPLSELKLNHVLKRQLINAGYTTLFEALNAPKSDIYTAISRKAFKVWCNLLDLYENDPELLIERLTKPVSQEHAAIAMRSVAIAKDDAIPKSTQKDSLTRNSSIYDEKTHNPLPKNETTDKLAFLEIKAKKALSILADHSDTALVAESFSFLAMELDDIEDGFTNLFKSNPKQANKALIYARLYFPNTFLVFISNAASRDFDGDAFWKNLFNKLNIESQSLQTQIKYAFYQGIKDKNFPYFTDEDNDFCYLNTALLHGGFSESFWEPMWADVVLPYSKNESVSTLSKKKRQRSSSFD